MLDEYYALHGRDRKSGWPARELLGSLGLKDGADLLEKAGKLKGIKRM